MGRDLEDMEFHILNKLYRQTNIGEDYIPFHDILQGLKPHQRSMKDAVKAASNLFKKGLIEFHKGKNCVSLNQRHVEDVEAIPAKRNGLQ